MQPEVAALRPEHRALEARQLCQVRWKVANRAGDKETAEQLVVIGKAVKERIAEREQAESVEVE